jgi:predicted small secreted protein
MRMLVVLIAAVIMVTGCNTLAGFGKDVEAAGSAMEKAGNKGKKN